MPAFGPGQVKADYPAFLHCSYNVGHFSPLSQLPKLVNWIIADDRHSSYEIDSNNSLMMKFLIPAVSKTQQLAEHIERRRRKAKEKKLYWMLWSGDQDSQ